MELPAADGRNIIHVHVDEPWDPHDDWNCMFPLDIMDDTSLDTDSNNSEHQRAHKIAEQKREAISISLSLVDKSLFHKEIIFDDTTEGNSADLKDDDSQVSDIASDDGFLGQLCSEPSGCACVELRYKI